MIDLTNEKFGDWTVIKRTGSRNGSALWLCECNCGNKKEVPSVALRKGKSKSCGCRSIDFLKTNKPAKTHGLTNHYLYATWLNMKSRCYNKKNTHFKYYGKRGIKVCDRWLNGENEKHGFECFIEDMGDRPKGKSLDRKNTDGNYEPSNCRWADRKTQSNNRREYKPKYKGKTTFFIQQDPDHKITREFEYKLASFTGAKYCITCSSCTDALFVSLLYVKTHFKISNDVTIPTKTYLSVPLSIIKAELNPIFDISKETNNWNGWYQLGDTGVYDSAKAVIENMYIANSFMCLSHHDKKPISCGKGGSILTDNEHAKEWIEKYVYEGRSRLPYPEENINSFGENMYLHPYNAEIGLKNFEKYSKKSQAQPKEDYQELHLMEYFSKFKTIG